MQVSEVMTKEVCSGSPLTNAAAAAELMWTNNVGSLPIVEEGGRIVGIVTDRDLFIALGTQNRLPSELTLGEVMRREPLICCPDDDLQDALRSMADGNVHRLIVADSGVLTGLLSIDDVVRQVGPDWQDNVARTLKTLTEGQTVVRP